VEEGVKGFKYDDYCKYYKDHLVMDLINRQNMCRDRTSALNVQVRKKCGLGDIGAMVV
jgi:hypothetical protein